MSAVGTIRTRSVVKSPDHTAVKKSAAPFFNAVIQPKLTIGPVNDPYEKEADAMADKVMRMEEGEKSDHREQEGDQPVQLQPMTGTPIQRKCAHCEEEEKLNRKQADASHHIQLKTITDTTIQKKCAACEEEEKNIHRKESGNSPAPVASESVYRTIQSSGSPLDHGTKSFMESRFNYDFSKVRIHDDLLAHRSSKEISARAYTHGQHIVFGSGQYQPHTYAGRQLLAHELTHVVQQGHSLKNTAAVQRDASVPSQAGTNITGRTKIDIRGQSAFRLSAGYGGSILYRLAMGATAVPVDVSFGNMGSATIDVHPKLLVFSPGCTETDLLPPFNVLVLQECGYYFNPVLSLYDADPQLIPVKLPGLDTSNKNGTLALKVEIRSNKIISNEINQGDTNRALAWVAGKTAGNLDPRADYASANFSEEAFLPFIYGKDYTGKNFDGTMYTNHLSGGYLIFNSVGDLSLPNQQKISGLIQLGDTANWWKTNLTTNIMGAKDYKLNIARTDRGELSGQGEGITLDESWTGKGFKAKGQLRISYVNSNFFVMGTASYESKRAQGNLLIVVTDYTTAKRYATEYLPADIAKKSQTDPPPNPADRLAFAGAGNISFTLFDGNKETRKKQAPPKNVIGKEQAAQPHHALKADASFVVEPEGYITIAGQIQTKEKEFVLFPPGKPYEETIPVLKVTLFKIPGPLGTSANFIFSVDLNYGATIGPLTLSEIRAEGLYSSRPDTASELELSGLIKMVGKLFVGLDICLSLEGGLRGLFSVDFIKECLHLKIAAVGAIQARPTIQLVIPAKGADRSAPPEYYIRGSFNFDAAGQLIFQIGDSFGINLTKKEEDKDKKDPKDPKAREVDKEWKYKRNRKTVSNRYGSKDVEIPMDHTLGSEEIPRVSLGNFIKDNLEERVKKLITQDRPPERKNEKEYFEHGKDKALAAAAGSDDKQLTSGGYEERGEERGEITSETKPAAPTPEKATYVFDEVFFMNGYRHKLSLIVSEITKGGARDFETVLMMASEPEEISEKIEEEKQDIKDHPDPAADFKKKDVAGIEAEANRIKDDARRLGIDNDLSNKPQYPELKELATSIHNYGDRYRKPDLGIADTTIQPKCNKPSDVHEGQEVLFPDYKGDGNLGKVIEVVSYVTPDRKSAYWHIKFRPYGSRADKTVAPPAFDEHCRPAYIITKAKNCEAVKIDKREKLVPERNINGSRIPDRFKASWVKAYPLCWGEELIPEDEVVGIDRIHASKRSKWHRAHLVHGKMGGPGTRWNLVPVPKHINNQYLPEEYEKDIKNLVQKGIGTGRQYWFEARIEYHQGDENAVIGHYNDFVKEIQVAFGELDKDAQGGWVFKPGQTKSVTLDRIPMRDDLAPDRVQG